ncbi:MAG: hypothetical protein Q9198_010828, partial [Flavoplaca austrocitrina]
LLVKLPLGCSTDSLDSLFQFRTGLPWYTKRVRAAGVCPHVRKGNFLRCALLQKESVLGIEKENGKGAMKETLFNVFHQVALSKSATDSWFAIPAMGLETYTLSCLRYRLDCRHCREQCIPHP